MQIFIALAPPTLLSLSWSIVMAPPVDRMPKHLSELCISIEVTCEYKCCKNWFDDQMVWFKDLGVRVDVGEGGVLFLAGSFSQALFELSVNL